MLNDLCEKRKSKISLSAPVFAAAVLILFAVFYPVLTGMRVNAWYPETLLRWFDGMWPF
jgi:hypothetical protein